MWTVISVAQGQSNCSTIRDARQRFYQVFLSHLNLETVRCQIGSCHYFNRNHFFFSFCKLQQGPCQTNCSVTSEEWGTRLSAMRCSAGGISSPRPDGRYDDTAVDVGKWPCAYTTNTAAARASWSHGGCVAHETETTARNVQLAGSLETENVTTNSQPPPVFLD